MKDLYRFLEASGETRTPDSVAVLQGLSNRTFRVILGSDDWVVRLASEKAERLGISRSAEGEVLRLAHAAGMAPDSFTTSFRKGI